MTEITVKNIWLRCFLDSQKPERLIDPVAFVGAFVLAPIFFAVAFCWVLLIPVVGVVLGAPAYILIGMPTLLLWMRRNQITAKNAMGLGVFSHLLFIPILWAFWMVFPEHAPRQIYPTLTWYMILGLFHAPFWCALFANLYGHWEHDFYKKHV